ncbi:uncharacterized protein LOC6557922 [Drosophila grimshawi]|nr:uncharacterized protein LOC6557922 [Drosophila grimshawi]
MASAGLWSIAVAASSRPIISISRATPLRQGYEEKDTARGFYSYGYSDENAARAEYTTHDGSSRGFYSYVDANGKLQTVKYEAGGGQGFKAEASNLPKAPVDDNKPPLPVTDTAEVEEARQAHLSAIQEARDQEQREQTAQAEQRQEQPQDEKPLSDEDADILERVRAELTSMLEQRQRGLENRNSDEENKKDSAAENNEEIRDRNQDQPSASEQQQQAPAPEQSLQLTNDANDLSMRTVYSLTDLSSSRYLKLSDLQDRSASGSQELRVPVSAYYAYTSPSARYSVTTPTELRTLRPVALSRSLLLSKRN